MSTHGTGDFRSRPRFWHVARVGDGIEHCSQTQVQQGALCQPSGLWHEAIGYSCCCYDCCTACGATTALLLQVLLMLLLPSVRTWVSGSGSRTSIQKERASVSEVVQHGCGLGQPNVICQMVRAPALRGPPCVWRLRASCLLEVLQYMCEKDNPGIRDGTKRGNQNTAGGEQEPLLWSFLFQLRLNPRWHMVFCTVHRHRNLPPPWRRPGGSNIGCSEATAQPVGPL